MTIAYFVIGGTVYAQQRAGEEQPVLWLLQDQLGSTRQVVDSEGTLYASYGYDAYGNLLASSTNVAITNIQWTGLRRDPETGLIYSWHRYYDPILGRWVSVDWIQDNLNNNYGYVGNGPTNAVDPTGLAINARFTLKEYLRTQGVWRDDRSSERGRFGEQYAYNYSDAFWGRSDHNLTQQILIGMLASETDFYIPGTSQQEVQDNLEKHIKTRIAIVQNAQTIGGFHFPSANRPMTPIGSSADDIEKCLKKPSDYTPSCYGAVLLMTWGGILDVLGKDNYTEALGAAIALDKQRQKQGEKPFDPPFLLAKRIPPDGNRLPLVIEGSVVDLGYDWIPGDSGAIAPEIRRPELDANFFSTEILIYTGTKDGVPQWRGHLGGTILEDTRNAQKWADEIGTWSQTGKITVPKELLYPTVGLDMNAPQ